MTLREQFLQVLDQFFDENELKQLCFALGVDYDNLSASGKINKAQELVSLLERQSRLPDLAAKGRDQNPTAPWPDLPTGPDGAPLPIIPDELRPYLKVLAQRTSRLPLGPLDPSGRDSAHLSLGQVFINLNAGERSDETTDPATGHVVRRLHRSALGHVYSHRHLILLGDPGSGKSTLLRFLAFCLAQAAMTGDTGWLQKLSWSYWETEVAPGAEPLPTPRPRQKGEPLVVMPGATLRREEEKQAHWPAELPIPVMVELRDFARTAFQADSPLALWGYACAQLQRAGFEAAIPALAALRERGQLFFLLDGADEVPVGKRTAVWRAVAALAEGPCVGNRWLATCRVLSFVAAEAPPIPAHTLEPLAQAQIDQFIAGWFAALAELGEVTPDQAESRSRQLQDASQRPRLRPLAANPMLLTIMALVQTFYGELPEERAKLYQACVDMLLLRWQRHKELDEPDVLTQLETTQENLERLLWAIAWEAQTRSVAQGGEMDKEADIPEVEVIRLAHDHLGGSWAKAEAFLAYTERRAHLLRGRGGVSEKVYAFPHRTFQEYLAACHLAAERRFGHRAAELAAQGDAWREVLNLAVGAMVSNRNNREKALDSIEKVLPHRLPDGDDGHGWNRVWLAGEMLAVVGRKEAEKDEVGREILPQVRQQLAALVAGGRLTPRQRAEAGNTLAALGDPRPGVLTCDAMLLCTVPAGPFWLENWKNKGQGAWYDGLDKPYWIGQYPVTVAQFREFVQNRDYEPDIKYYLQLPDNWPVVWVSWYDALAFTDWLNARWQPWLPDGYRVVLPNEVEWEKAARGGQRIPQTPQILTCAELMTAKPITMGPNVSVTGEDLSRRRFPWGNKPEQEPIASGWLYRANNHESGIGDACTVGSFPSGVSPYGCLDMSGQVWEWTRSFFGMNYPYHSEPAYETLDAHTSEFMVVRGGAYYTYDSGCGKRDWEPSDTRGAPNGIRVAVSPFVPSAL